MILLKAKFKHLKATIMGNNISNNVTETTSVTKKKSSLPFVIAGVATLLVATAIVLVIVFFRGGATGRKYSKQMKIADMYMTDMDYPNAVLAYDEAISINPGKADAYLGLAKAYVALGKTESARSALERALDNVTDEEEREKIKDEIEKLGLEEMGGVRIEMSEVLPEEVSLEFKVISPSKLPGGEEALSNFLCDFNWWSEDFDCENSKNCRDLVQFILSLGFEVCDYDLYSDYISGPEPNADNWAHYKEFGVDWIVENIYNFSAEDVEELKKELSQKDVGKDENGEWTMLSYKDGEYIAGPAGSGGGYVIQFKDIQTDGILYRVTYDTYFESELEGVISHDFEATKYALMEYKIINGKGYWSVYKVSSTDFFNEQTIRLVK